MVKALPEESYWELIVERLGLFVDKNYYAAYCNLNLDGETFVFSLPSVTVLTPMFLRNLNNVSTASVS